MDRRRLGTGGRGVTTAQIVDNFPGTPFPTGRAYVPTDTGPIDHGGDDGADGPPGQSKGAPSAPVPPLSDQCQICFHDLHPRAPCRRCDARGGPCRRTSASKGMTEDELIAAYGGWPGYVEWVKLGVAMGWKDQDFLDRLMEAEGKRHD